MSLIFETSNYVVKSAERPHVFVDRREGGHIEIWPKVPVADRTKLSRLLANEYMLVSTLVGEALKAGMGKGGIDVGIVNYQDMGNLSVFASEGPKMHMHVFGRATDATKQKYGWGVVLPHPDTGWFDDYEELDAGDIKMIRKEIKRLAAMEKYEVLEGITYT